MNECMSENIYNIGSHKVGIYGEKLVNAVGKLHGFAPFAQTNGNDMQDGMVEQEAFSFHYAGEEYSGSRPEEVGELLYTSENDGVASEFYSLDEGRRYLQRMRRSGKSFKPATPWAEELYLIIDKTESKGFFYGALVPQMLRFALWIGYGAMTTDLHTLAIHSSCIIYKGRAVIFLGESGTGKSTHTRLWRENIEGAFLLNDDSPVVRSRMEEVGSAGCQEVYVYGSPWSGKTPCYRQERYPLAAVVRLYQAPFNKIEKLSLLRAYSALHPSCPPDFAYSQRLYDGISATIGDILERVPVYMMGCLPDKDAATVSCKAIFG